MEIPKYLQKHLLEIFRRVEYWEHCIELMDDFPRKCEGGLFHRWKSPEIPKNLLGLIFLHKKNEEQIMGENSSDWYRAC